MVVAAEVRALSVAMAAAVAADHLVCRAAGAVPRLAGQLHRRVRNRLVAVAAAGLAATVVCRVGRWAMRRRWAVRWTVAAAAFSQVGAARWRDCHRERDLCLIDLCLANPSGADNSIAASPQIRAMLPPV